MKFEISLTNSVKLHIYKQLSLVCNSEYLSKDTHLGELHLF